jgi:hypothetical protein
MHLQTLAHGILLWAVKAGSLYLLKQLWAALKGAFLDSVFGQVFTTPLWILTLPFERMYSFARSLAAILLFVGMIGTVLCALRRSSPTPTAC